MSLTVSCPVQSSYRVQQIAGMFDVAVAEKTTQTFHFDLPPIESNWHIGCIVGPSGSGKSTIAKHLFRNNYYSSENWSSDNAVIDGFGDLPIKNVTKMLTAVGFSSPPGWIKPYAVLSNGEKFRCDLARALLQTGTVVFDEYTSVVDRSVAQIASAAISKGIKTGRIPCRFVAVTCHYDILDWLEPDWVLDTATGTVSRRLLRRPDIELGIFRCRSDLWKLFKNHHYLSGTLSKACRCYAALWQNKPVAFCALIPQHGFENWFRVSRIVTLPDYQGAGIGSALLDSLAGLYADQHYRFSITASHPSVISHCKRSKHWKAINVMKTGSLYSGGRAVVSFLFQKIP
jgi:GNAT superfamily N-acetyltransferase